MESFYYQHGPHKVGKLLAVQDEFLVLLILPELDCKISLDQSNTEIMLTHQSKAHVAKIVSQQMFDTNGFKWPPNIFYSKQPELAIHDKDPLVLATKFVLQAINKSFVSHKRVITTKLNFTQDMWDASFGESKFKATSLTTKTYLGYPSITFHRDERSYKPLSDFFEAVLCHFLDHYPATARQTVSRYDSRTFVLYDMATYSKYVTIKKQIRSIAGNFSVKNFIKIKFLRQEERKTDLKKLKFEGNFRLSKLQDLFGTFSVTKNSRKYAIQDRRNTDPLYCPEKGFVAFTFKPVLAELSIKFNYLVRAPDNTLIE